jgi:hypothetical protein
MERTSALFYSVVFDDKMTLMVKIWISYIFAQRCRTGEEQARLRVARERDRRRRVETELRALKQVR